MDSSSPSSAVASPGAGGERRVLALAVAGGLVFVAGLFLEPRRVWLSYLLAFSLLAQLALAGPVFLALLALSGARWATALRRVPEAMGGALPLALAAGAVLLSGMHSLYEWSHPAALEHDALLAHKAAWLNPTGFAVRTLVILALWWAGAAWLRRSQAGAPARRLARSGVFMVLVAVSFSIASVDWWMSLEPHWFSTLFPLYHFAGLACAGLAMALLLVLHLERRGPLAGVVRDEHLHDMGRLLFAFTLVWAYLWYCQYMLIWYTDIPEETGYYLLRKQHGWWLLVQCTLVLKWGVPFLALLGRRPCRSRRVLGRVAVVVLVGHVLDLYVQIAPPLMDGGPRLGAWELGPTLAALALFLAAFGRSFRRAPPVPEGDPALPDSLAYHVP